MVAALIFHSPKSNRLRSLSSIKKCLLAHYDHNTDWSLTSKPISIPLSSSSFTISTLKSDTFAEKVYKMTVVIEDLSPKIEFHQLAQLTPSAVRQVGRKR